MMGSSKLNSLKGMMWWFCIFGMGMGVMLLLPVMTTGFVASDSAHSNSQKLSVHEVQTGDESGATTPDISNDLGQDRVDIPGPNFDDGPNFVDDAVPNQLAGTTSIVSAGSGPSFNDEPSFSDQGDPLITVDVNLPLDYYGSRFDVSQKEMLQWKEISTQAVQSFGEGGKNGTSYTDTLIFARPRGMTLFNGQSDFDKRKSTLTSVANPEFTSLWFLQRTTTVVKSASASTFQFMHGHALAPALCPMDVRRQAVRVEVTDWFNATVVDHRDDSKVTISRFALLKAVDAYGRVTKIKKPVPIQQFSPWYGKDWTKGTVVCKSRGEMAQVLPGWPVYVPDFLDTYFSANVEIVSVTTALMPTFGNIEFYHLILRTVKGQATKSKSKLVHITCINSAFSEYELPTDFHTIKTSSRRRKCQLKRRRSTKTITLKCGGLKYGKIFTINHLDVIDLENIHRAHKEFRNQLASPNKITGRDIFELGGHTAVLAMQTESPILAGIVLVAVAAGFVYSVYRRKKMKKISETLAVESLLYDVVLMQS
eukprot:GHVT01053535.1.p1 GENE.GHVT01053535.1~~GHVT01053535.1.p1  ORF type:complete len:537 (+),score=22.28 GHVT01053535.1:557-2167(+)